MPLSETLRDEYLAMEYRLGEAYRELFLIRHPDMAEERERRESKLMAEVHARLLPRMEVLRTDHPELASRALPMMLKTPGQLKVAEAMERIDAGLQRVLTEKLPVRLVFEEGEEGHGLWSLEQVEQPQYLLGPFYSEEEALVYAETHKLPLAVE